MERELGFERTHALALSSVAVDLHVTQIVNLAKGVHAVLRDGALAVVPRQVVHPGLPGGWWLSKTPAPEEDPDEAAR